MTDEDLKLRNSLRQSDSFRRFVDTLRAKEANFGEQNQSPDISGNTFLVVFNDNYVSKTELFFLCCLVYYLNTTKLKFSCPILLCELLITLPDKILKSEFLTDSERIELLKLVTRRTQMYLTSEWPLVRREILGIISNRQIQHKVLKRLYQKRRKAKAKRKVFHRGYRDHGTLPDPTLWLPEKNKEFTPYQLTNLQNQIEQRRDRLKAYEVLVRKGLNPVAIEDFPTIFDDI